ncbi:formate/nitrite transporter family protein [Fusibacter ferrireducens]|uniref:Formate/nitrite transporter family protein n=1 Tax=Fusibacter ferrireducens TaxID=2785058 RepID=A0ABR9ZX17_9FIRM|nr:formate/nitrite transporter family protein [Fusibacter ferrireducens]MBF4695002.1 formate/nitrite transporter family protein [Fusibacter ferrireducens]
MKTDYEIYGAVIKTGVQKTKKKNRATLSAGILGGAYIALGSIGYLAAVTNIQPAGVGKLLGSFLFPVGLLLILITGAELFTGNNLLSLSAMHGESKWQDVFSNWIKIYCYNAIGAMFIAFLVHMGGYDQGDFLHVIEKVVHAKVALSFSEALARGILCNILVAIAVWISYSSDSAGGKAVLIWLPITLFVYSGYEHCVANMLYFSLAWFAGVQFSIADFLGNMVPVTIGNILGGGIVLPVLYYGMFKNKK